jgi:hypothetical protein
MLPTTGENSVFPGGLKAETLSLANPISYYSNKYDVIVLGEIKLLKTRGD